MIKSLNYIIMLFLLISCNEKQKEFKNKVFFSDGAAFFVRFPDTVYKNQKYNGEIKYKNLLDTVSESMVNDYRKKKNRYIIFSLTTTKNIDYPEEYLWKIAKDTFGAIDNNTIPFSNIKFNDTGTHYIDGVINDQAYITSDIRNEKGDYDTRIITNEFRATHKVIVIDKSNNHR